MRTREIVIVLVALVLFLIVGLSISRYDYDSAPGNDITRPSQ
jgi:hypothetical protein